MKFRLVATAFSTASKLALCFAPEAGAQNFPTRPVRVIVPSPPGGGPDTIARLMSPPMAHALGQAVVIENRPGGNGVAAMLELINSPADGYTTALPDSSHWAIFPQIQKEVPYDFLRDTAPIGLIFVGPQYVTVLASHPAKDLRELIAMARAKPGSMRYGTAGFGGVVHLWGETFKSKLGLDVAYVPYKGSGQLMEAILRGEIDYGMPGYTNIKGYVESGKLRVLASGWGRRFPATPDVPTVAEAAGLPGFDFAGVLGMIGRAGTPRPVIDRLSAALNKSLADPELLKRALGFGLEITPSTPEQYDALVRADIRKFGEAIKAANIPPQ